MTHEEAWTISNNFELLEKKLKDLGTQIVFSSFLLSISFVLGRKRKI